MKRMLVWITLLYCTFSGLMFADEKSDDKPPGTAVTHISIESHKAMNQNTALRVDYVVVYEKNLANSLKDMQASAYFGSVEQLYAQNKENLYILRWEVTPESLLEGYPIKVRDPKKVWSVMVFVDYLAEKSSRVSVEKEIKLVRIILGKETVTLDGQKEYAPNRALLRQVPFEATIVMDDKAAFSGQLEASKPSEEVVRGGSE